MFSLREFFNITWYTTLSCASLCANYCSTNDINYIPLGLIKSLCGNDRIFAKDLKPYCFKPTPKVVENTTIIVKIMGK